MEEAAKSFGVLIVKEKKDRISSHFDWNVEICLICTWHILILDIAKYIEKDKLCCYILGNYGMK